MKVNTLSTRAAIAALLTVLLLLFILGGGTSETTASGAGGSIGKLLAYLDQLSPYATLYMYQSCLTEKNSDSIVSNRYKRQDIEIDAANAGVSIIFYARSSNTEIMEELCGFYDVQTSSPLRRTLYKFDGERTDAFSIDTNWVVKKPDRDFMLYDQNGAIEAVMNPLAAAVTASELDELRGNLHVNEGKIVTTANRIPVFKVECLVRDAELLYPPSELRRYSGDRLLWDISLEAKEFSCSSGQKWMFPLSIAETLHVFPEPAKASIAVLGFDKPTLSNIAAMLDLRIPDTAAIYDEALDLQYVYKAPRHEHLTEPYPTKFEFFGMTLEDAKRLIDKTIREDRARYAASQAAK